MQGPDKNMVEIPNHPNYLISEDGKIYSLKVNRFLCPHTDRDGYLRTALSENGKRYDYAVHRLVVIAFIRSPIEDEQINHIDLDKQNNHYSNLEWCTIQENIKHRDKNRSAKTDKFLKSLGQRVAQKLRKYTDKQIIEMRRLRKEGYSLKSLSEKYNERVDTISKICRGRMYGHIGGIVESKKGNNGKTVFL